MRDRASWGPSLSPFCRRIMCLTCELKCRQSNEGQTGGSFVHAHTDRPRRRELGDRQMKRSDEQSLWETGSHTARRPFLLDSLLPELTLAALAPTADDDDTREMKLHSRVSH